MTVCMDVGGLAADLPKVIQHLVPTSTMHFPRLSLNLLNVKPTILIVGLPQNIQTGCQQ